MEFWCIDAGMSHDVADGIFCYCRCDRDGTNIRTGEFVTGKWPPGPIVGIYHHHGPEAALLWHDANREQLNALKQRVEGVDVPIL